MLDSLMAMKANISAIKRSQPSIAKVLYCLQKHHKPEDRWSRKEEHTIKAKKTEITVFTVKAKENQAGPKIGKIVQSAF